jgi:hypothetical protein
MTNLPELIFNSIEESEANGFITVEKVAAACHNTHYRISQAWAWAGSPTPAIKHIYDNTTINPVLVLIIDENWEKILFFPVASLPAEISNNL